MNNLFKILLFLSFVAFLYFSPGSAVAADFATDYDVQYFPTLSTQDLSTQVSFKIKITNLKPDLYIKTFSLSFPKNFLIGNIKISDDFGPIGVKIDQSEDKQAIVMQFTDPQIGLNAKNTLYLDFLQTNLFKSNGNIWEVILPTIEGREQGEYSVTVHVPPTQNKKISISKPKPDTISSNQIVWKNPKQKTIYAVFGTEQYYSTKLRYHLENQNFTRVYTDIAFPPDTLYQKLYVNSIIPKPDSIHIDDDGNYMGRYILNPKESKDIFFDATIQVFAFPREELISVISTEYRAYKKNLLSVDKNWTLLDSQSTKRYTSIQDIYSFVISTLQYNYGRITSKISRMGSSEALKYPDQAVCSEFSDVFIALSRENGFITRELQGYGISNDEELRPLSLTSDVLHSWPEYFDESRMIWVPIDPTWEHTSGIDYFSSLDFNHIVFAVHGKKSDYPYPAGSYKSDNETKDVQIVPMSNAPVEKKLLSITQNQQPVPVNSQNGFKVQLSVENKGSSYLWNLPINFSADGLKLTQDKLQLSAIAPYQKKMIEVEYKLINQWQKTDTVLKVYSNDLLLQSLPITTYPLPFLILKNTGIILGIIMTIYIIIRLLYNK